MSLFKVNNARNIKDHQKDMFFEEVGVQNVFGFSSHYQNCVLNTYQGIKCKCSPVLFIEPSLQDHPIATTVIQNLSRFFMRCEPDSYTVLVYFLRDLAGVHCCRILNERVLMRCDFRFLSCISQGWGTCSLSIISRNLIFHNARNRYDCCDAPTRLSTIPSNEPR